MNQVRPNGSGQPFVSLLPKSFIDVIVKAGLSAFSKILTSHSYEFILPEKQLEDEYRAYLLRTIEKCIYVNTMVFPSQKVKLEQIYQPISIRIDKKSEPVIIELEHNVLPLFDNGNILISDYAGMGKSTLAKLFALSALRNNSVPIIVELRKLNRKNSIVREIISQFTSTKLNYNHPLVYDLLEQGFFTIVLDGLDEVPGDNKTEVIREIENFIYHAGRNKILITSRPESSLSAFSEFVQYSISPLEKNESFSLLEKYDLVSGQDLSIDLINDINNKLVQVHEFLKNPFLTSLLYRTYTYTKSIPDRKIAFYEEIYRALFQNHDTMKGGFRRLKKSGLDIHQMRQVLIHLGFLTSKIGRISFFQPEFEHILKDINERNLGFTFNVDLLLGDLIEAVPLFLREGMDIRWAHKSIQDYFAATYIAYSKDNEQILQKIYESRKDQYLNVLDLIEELNRPVFESIVLLPILHKYVNHYKQFRRSFKTLPNNTDIVASLSFDRNICICKFENLTCKADVERTMKEKKYDILPDIFKGDKYSLCIWHSQSFDQLILNYLSHKERYDFFIQREALTSGQVYKDIDLVEIAIDELLEFSDYFDSQIIFKIEYLLFWQYVISQLISSHKTSYVGLKLLLVEKYLLQKLNQISADWRSKDLEGI